MRPLKLNGIDTYIDFTEWHVGSSVFIPSPYPEGVLKELKKEFEFKNFDWTYRTQIEDGMLGVRIWRLR